MKNKIFAIGLLLLGSSAFYASADSFYLNLNQPGIQLGVNTDGSNPAPGVWYYGGRAYHGAPVPPPKHDKKAWKRYKKMRKEYEKQLRKHPKHVKRPHHSAPVPGKHHFHH